MKKYAVISEKGHFRTINEDCAKIIRGNENSTLAVLCDGMGGYENGEVASQITVRVFEREFKKIHSYKMSNDAIKKWIDSTVSIAVKLMRKLASEDSSHQRMGTTLVLCILDKKHTIFASIGDSRGYWYRKTKIEQVTTDQNIQNMLIRSGASAKEALNHPQGHALFSSLGPDKFAITDFFSFTGFRKNILLTTDGIHDYISESQIHKVLKKRDLTLEEKLSILVNRAEEGGSKDNLSAIIVERDYYAKRI